MAASALKLRNQADARGVGLLGVHGEEASAWGGTGIHIHQRSSAAGDCDA